MSEFVQGPIDYPYKEKRPDAATSDLVDDCFRKKHTDIVPHRRRRQKAAHPEVFDPNGRMKYNPDFHFSHGKPFSESDNEYLCKFAEVDGFNKIGYAIGKTAISCQTQMQRLKKLGLIDHYKSLNKYWV